MHREYFVMKLKTLIQMFISTSKCWDEDNVSHLAAALSYYTIFSLAPVLVICIALAGIVFGQDEVSARVIDQLGNALGNDTAVEIKMLLANIHQPSTNVYASILGGITLIWGTLGLFNELQNSFNVVWKVKPKPNLSWRTILKNRLFSFTIVLGVSFLLLVSLLFSAFLKATADHIYHLVPRASDAWLIMDFLISTGGITFLFALIFKVVLDVVIKWRDVGLGAFVTALLFTLGKFLLGIYLAKSNIATSFGAAASLIIILVWVYYSAQILLFGAEFTKVYAHTCGSRIRSKDIARRIK